MFPKHLRSAGPSFPSFNCHNISISNTLGEDKVSSLYPFILRLDFFSHPSFWQTKHNKHHNQLLSNLLAMNKGLQPPRDDVETGKTLTDLFSTLGCDVE